METIQTHKINGVLKQLFRDSKKDHLKILKGLAKNILRPFQPSSFKDVYLSISEEQGKGLVQLIENKKLKSIVEFGTSFGISTLFLAKGVNETGGKIITTELIESKAKQAIENFKNAGVNELIDVRIGDAMKTLKDFDSPIDLLLLDGWKDLYLPLFEMLEPNFHQKTIIYVDNADMSDTRSFLHATKQKGKYSFQSQYDGKVVLISMKIEFKK